MIKGQNLCILIEELFAQYQLTLFNILKLINLIYSKNNHIETDHFLLIFILIYWAVLSSYKDQLNLGLKFSTNEWGYDLKLKNDLMKNSFLWMQCWICPAN